MLPVQAETDDYQHWKDSWQNRPANAGGQNPGCDLAVFGFFGVFCFGDRRQAVSAALCLASPAIVTVLMLIFPAPILLAQA